MNTDVATLNPTVELFGRSRGPARIFHRLVLATLAAAAVLALGHPPASRAQPALVRGPYLQTGTQTNITIQWRTGMLTSSRVVYGTNASLLDQTVLSMGLRTNHIVVLQNLKPNTRYYYAVGNGENLISQGPDHHFITAPDQPKPVRLWVIGDSGTASAGVFGSHLVRDAYHNYMGTNETDAWLMLGDNAYYSGLDHEYQVAVFETYPNLLRRVPLWPTIGNHETYGAESNGYFAYLDIFSPPQNGEAGGVPSGTKRYYSFNYANIHFVCLDSETSARGPDGPMLRWLRQDLLENTSDWLIAFWHTPPYSKGSHNSDTESSLIGMRTNIVPVLEEFGVDLVLCGHSHNYERSFLINGHYGHSSTLVPSMILNNGSGRTNETGAYVKSRTGPVPNAGAVYVVAGSSGWATFATGSHPAMHTQILAIGSLILDVNGNRMDAKFLRETGAVQDYFTIIKGASPQPFKLVGFLLSNGNNVLTWNSQPGRSYQVQQTDHLTPQDWINASPVLSASGLITIWTNPAPATLDQTYYRVVER